MDFLSTLVSFQFLLLTLAIAGVTYVFRNIFEAIWKLDEKKLWADLLLPCLPIILGGFIGLIPQLPMPVTITSLSGRVMMGIVGGLLSAHTYRVIKAMLAKQEIS